MTIHLSGVVSENIWAHFRAIVKTHQFYCTLIWCVTEQFWILNCLDSLSTPQVSELRPTLFVLCLYSSLQHNFHLNTITSLICICWLPHFCFCDKFKELLQMCCLTQSKNIILANRHSVHSVPDVLHACIVLSTLLLSKELMQRFYNSKLNGSIKPRCHAFYNHVSLSAFMNNKRIAGCVVSLQERCQEMKVCPPPPHAQTCLCCLTANAK